MGRFVVTREGSMRFVKRALAVGAGLLLLVIIGGGMALDRFLSGGPAARLPVPLPSQVERIVIPSARVIEDPRTIARFLTFLDDHSGSWRKSWHTFPSPRWSIALEGKDGLVMVLWLGHPDTYWIGARPDREQDEAWGQRTRSLSEGDWNKVHEILGIPKNK